MTRFVVIDLEMCNVSTFNKKTQYPYNNEVIQIGAVLLDDEFEIEDSFVSFVLPKYGAVDKYIQKLTGIAQQDLVGAPDFETAMRSFVEWLPKDAVLVSWSNTDRSQLQREMEGKGIELPEMVPFFETWVDSQKLFGEKANNTRNYKLSEALILAAIDYQDGEHDALIDAKNTALLFAKMKKEPDFKLSAVCASTEEATSSTYNPFVDLLAGFSFAE